MLHHNYNRSAFLFGEKISFSFKFSVKGLEELCVYLYHENLTLEEMHNNSTE